MPISLTILLVVAAVVLLTFGFASMGGALRFLSRAAHASPEKAATRVATIGSGARSIDTWDKYVAFGLEGGEVVLGTRSGGTLETERLTAKSGK